MRSLGEESSITSAAMWSLPKNFYFIRIHRYNARKELRLVKKTKKNKKNADGIWVLSEKSPRY